MRKPRHREVLSAFPKSTQLVRSRASIGTQVGLDPKSMISFTPLCHPLGKDYLCAFWVSFQSHPGRSGTEFCLDHPDLGSTEVSKASTHSRSLWCGSGSHPLSLCLLPLPSILSVQASVPAPHSLTPTHTLGDLVRGYVFQWKSYEFKSCLCCYLTVYLWAKHLPSLILFCHLLKGYNAPILQAILRLQ